MFKISEKRQQLVSVPLKRVNKSMNRLMNLRKPLHDLCTFSSITRWCANLFQNFPLSVASICTLSFILKLNAGSVLKVNICVAKIGRHLGCYQQIVMSLVGLANGKPRRCYYTCDHMTFMKWVISLNNMTVL